MSIQFCIHLLILVFANVVSFFPHNTAFFFLFILSCIVPFIVSVAVHWISRQFLDTFLIPFLQPLFIHVFTQCLIQYFIRVSNQFSIEFSLRFVFSWFQLLFNPIFMHYWFTLWTVLRSSSVYLPWLLYNRKSLRVSFGIFRHPPASVCVRPSSAPLIPSCLAFFLLQSAVNGIESL